MAGAIAKSTSVILNQFGTLLVQDAFTAKNKSKDEARNQLSLIFLISNIISMLACLIVGFYSDRIKIFHLMTGTNIVVLFFLGMMVYDVASHELEDLGLLFYIGYTMALGLHICTFMLSISQMSKLVSAATRGSMLSLNAVAGSACIFFV